MSKSVRKYPINIPGKGDIKEVRRAVVPGNAHIRWKVLISKYKTFSVGNDITNTCNVSCDIKQLQH